MPSDDVSKTPMLRQYLEIKEQHKDAILFYRIGDFYEMFYEDAVVASKVLDIVLTSRNKNDPNPVPLCGIPWHSSQSYLEKLVEKGFKVAICDQVENPDTAKGIVKREVIRVVTPGLSASLENSESSRSAPNHCLVALHKGEKNWGLALLELGTGNFRVTEITQDKESLLNELLKISPREIVVSEKFDDTSLGLGSRFCLSRLPAWVWDETFARRVLYHQFQVATLSGFGCEEVPSAAIAAGAALHYAKETQRVDRFSHLTSLKRYERGTSMHLGEESRNNLSLNDLIELMDQTKTAMGRRCLKEWFYAPLLKKDPIERRLDAVEELLGQIGRASCRERVCQYV